MIDVVDQLLYMVFDVGFLYWMRWFFFFQAEDGIRDLVRSRGLGDVYKRQVWEHLISESLWMVL